MSFFRTRPAKLFAAIIAVAALAVAPVVVLADGPFRVVPATKSDTVNITAQRYSGTGNGTLTVAAFTSIVPETIMARCTTAAANGGTFTLTSNRRVLSDASVAVGVAHSSDGLVFTIADGSTDYIVGDEFQLDIVRSKYLIVHTTDGLGDTVKVTLPDGSARALTLPDGPHAIEAVRVWSTGTAADNVTVLY